MYTDFLAMIEPYRTEDDIHVFYHAFKHLPEADPEVDRLQSLYEYLAAMEAGETPFVPGAYQGIEFLRFATDLLDQSGNGHLVV